MKEEQIQKGMKSGVCVSAEEGLNRQKYSAPNDKTIKAMEATRRGDLVSVGSADNLLTSLNMGD